MKPLNENAPTCGRSRGANQNDFNSGKAPLENLLSRLENVQKRGERYRAKCPAHGGKNTGTLSVSETNEGKILIKCWVGCSAQEVICSIGLEMTDLFPARLKHHSTPEQIQKWKQNAIHHDWCDFLNIAAYEMNIIYVAGGVIRAGKPLSDENNIRLDIALERIRQIGEYFNGNA